MRINSLIWPLAGLVGAAAIVLALPRLSAAAEMNAFGLRALRAVQEGSAVAPARDLAERAPGSPSGQHILGMAALNLGDAALADQALARALAGDPASVQVVRAARPVSRDLAALAYSLYPGDADAAVWQGDVEEQAGQADRALALYRAAAALAPGDNLTWEKAGLLAERLGQPDVAREAFGRACDINPVRNGACYHAAQLSYAAGDWANTVHYYVAGGMPDHPDSWVRIIRAAQRLGRSGDAERYLQLAGARYPADYGQLLQADP